MPDTIVLHSALYLPGGALLSAAATAQDPKATVAAGGTSIGNKGMIVASKTLAMTVVDLFTRPELVESARIEHAERIPDGWEYQPLLGDRAPPLDYRLPAGPGN